MCLHLRQTQTDLYDTTMPILMPANSIIFPPPLDFRSLWRGVSLDGLAEGDIERYLQNVGLGAMQGETRYGTWTARS